jgi:hypothetical protein
MKNFIGFPFSSRPRFTADMLRLRRYPAVTGSEKNITCGLDFHLCQSIAVETGRVAYSLLKWGAK